MSPALELPGLWSLEHFPVCFSDASQAVFCFSSLPATCTMGPIRSSLWGHILHTSCNLCLRGLSFHRSFPEVGVPSITKIQHIEHGCRNSRENHKRPQLTLFSHEQDFAVASAEHLVIQRHVCCILNGRVTRIYEYTIVSVKNKRTGRTV